MMKTATPILVHVPVLERFKALFRHDRLAHAYLFSGPVGIGKFETALAVARLINCEVGAKDVMACPCPSCRKIAAGNHPDILIIERLEDKTTIGIDQIRDHLLPRMSLKPSEGSWKIAIVKDADLMTVDASNAFLKTLEEPTRATLLILTTTAPAGLLGTIKSRCHEVRFFPLGHDELALQLKNEYDVPLIEAGILARFAAGSPGRAAGLMKDFLDDKNQWLSEFVFRPADDAVIKKFSADKDLTRELCQVLLTLYRDILLLKGGAGDEVLFHRDRLVDIKRLAGKYSADDVERLFAQTVKVREAADENFNVKIALTILKEMM